MRPLGGLMLSPTAKRKGLLRRRLKGFKNNFSCRAGLCLLKGQHGERNWTSKCLKDQLFGEKQ
jgi:hypothetical protein